MNKTVSRPENKDLTSQNLEPKTLNPNILETRDVYILTFDDTGTLADVSKRDKAASKEVDPSTAATYTQGQSLGIIDQFLFNLGRGL